MRFSAATDKGRVRLINEDSLYVPNDPKNDIPLFIVADGLGGHNAGEVASNEAIKFIVKYISDNFNNITRDKNSVKNLIRKSIWETNLYIYEMSIAKSELRGMATTLTLVLVDEEKFFVGHIGDSRVYVIRNNRIYQITRDHSYVEQLIRDGTITREQANNHPQKNVITRALGVSRNLEVDVSVRKLYNDDILLICTDGLTNFVSDQQIKQIVLSTESCDEIVQTLIRTANEAGGKDNITVIVMKN